MKQNKIQQNDTSRLGTEPIGRLLAGYAIPCIISLLVGALYNIVDQIFIANAPYLGSFGNAANTVVFPLTVIALGIAVMIGDGTCAFVSISLGARRDEEAHRGVGNAIVLCLASSVVLTLAYLAFADPILTAFGGRVNPETFELAREYFFWIALGIPFYMFGQAMNPIIRSDGSPRFAMLATLAGAILNVILDPIFIYPMKLGMTGAAVATVLGIVRKFVQLAISIAIGLAAGCIPIAGYNVGAGLHERARKLFKSLLVTEGAIGIVALLVAELLPRQLIGIFGAGNESAYYTEFAIKSFRVYLCGMPLAMLNKGTFIYLQAIGKAIPSTVISMTREIVFGVSLPIILPVFMGLDGILVSFPLADVLTFCMTLVFIIRSPEPVA